MAYNTGNPIGSSSPKDLIDNAEDFDYLLNGVGASHPNRLGMPLKSWQGMQQEFNADQIARANTFIATQNEKKAEFDAAQLARTTEYGADKLARDTEFDADQDNRDTQFNTLMEATGYEPPIPYASGILLNRTTKTVSYLGNEYRAKGAFIPMTTSNWAADEAKLKLIGDDSLRQQMAGAEGSVLSGYKARNVNARLGEKVSILDYGAAPKTAYSETLINDRTAWNNAQTAAGASGVVHFPLLAGSTETHYYIGDGIVYLHNCYTSFDPGVVLHCADISNDVAHPRRNLTPATISRNYPGRTGTYGFELGATKDIAPYLGLPAAIHSASLSGERVYDRVSLSTYDPIRISNFATGAYTEDGAGMASQGFTSVNWTDGAAAGVDHQGLMIKAPTSGMTYEFLFDIPNTNSVTGTFNVVLGRQSTCARWEFTAGATDIKFYNGNTLVRTIAARNLMDTIATNVGCTRAAVRVLAGNAFQLVLNDMIYDTQALASPARYLAWTVSQTARAYSALKYHNKSDRKIFAAGRDVKVLCIGDSQTAGANASVTWPRLLEQVAQHLPGIGRLTVDNIAVSGTSTSYWNTAIASINCSGYDRVLIMLGINNNQSLANTGLGTFLSDIVAIGNKIVADGSRPIYGMNTRYTSPALSLGGGNTTNHGIFARYNAVLKDHCGSYGYELAETIELFGNNAGLNGSFVGEIAKAWHTDNIHPGANGQIALAAAFGDALSRDIARPYPVARLRAGSLSPAAPWVVLDPANNGYLRWAIRDGVLYLRGKVRRDPGSSASIVNTTIATLPSSVPVSASGNIVVRTQDVAENSLCELTINQDGTIVAGPNARPSMIDITGSMLL